jgi:hypothetical protein
MAGFPAGPCISDVRGICFYLLHLLAAECRSVVALIPVCTLGPTDFPAILLLLRQNRKFVVHILDYFSRLNVAGRVSGNSTNRFAMAISSRGALMGTSFLSRTHVYVFRIYLLCIYAL